MREFSDRGMDACHEWQGMPTDLAHTECDCTWGFLDNDSARKAYVKKTGCGVLIRCADSVMEMP